MRGIALAAGFAALASSLGCGGTVVTQNAGATGSGASPASGAGAGTGNGTGAGTGAGTGVGTGTASGGPPADAAWTVNMQPGTAGTCLHGADFTDSFGTVSATSVDARVSNGGPVPSAAGQVGSVSCSVTGTGSFAVTAKANDTEQELTIEIASIAPSATQSSPATGSVAYTSAKFTADNTYQGSCAFYFKPGTPETVASGKIWGAFTCPMVTSTGGTSDTCALAESVFVFESCQE